MDLKADRKDRRLLVLAAYIESHAKPGQVAPALGAELKTMAGWLGLESVVVAKQGDLGRACGGGWPPSIKHVGHGDLTDFNPINHHRNVLTGGEIDA